MLLTLVWWQLKLKIRPSFQNILAQIREHGQSKGANATCVWYNPFVPSRIVSIVVLYGILQTHLYELYCAEYVRLFWLVVFNTANVCNSTDNRSQILGSHFLLMTLLCIPEPALWGRVAHLIVVGWRMALCDSGSEHFKGQGIRGRS